MSDSSGKQEQSQPESGLARLRRMAVGDEQTADRANVHQFVRAATEWSWRLIVLVVAIYLFAHVAKQFEDVVVPVAIALLASAFLNPAVRWMTAHRVPRGLSVLIALLVAIGLVAAIMTFVVQQFIDGLPDLTTQATHSINELKDWLVNGPAHMKKQQVDNVGNDVVDMLQKNQDKITSGAIATATTVTKIVTGGLLALFLTIFFLYDGRGVWTFTTRVIPAKSRAKVTEAGVDAFKTLSHYVRATVAVAAVDAIGIGAGLAIMQVPLALPLASLIFVGAFIPIVGAVATGALAVVIALVTKGWVVAVIVLAIVIAVMQIEGHVLQPFLLGRSVRLHPVAVVLTIAAGIVAAGIIGGLLAVPLMAVLNTAIRSILAANKREAEAAETGEDSAGTDPGSADETAENPAT